MSFHSVLLTSLTRLCSKINQQIYTYGECTTARNVAAKTVSITGFKLKAGARVYIRFTTTVTSNPTSGNLTLNVNNTGAKNIVISLSNKVVMNYSYAWEFSANRLCEFVYDGTNWCYVNMDNNTTNSAGSTNKASTKMFLVGTTTQANGTTSYSNSKCYVGTDNEIYSNGKKVITEQFDITGKDTNDIMLITTSEM